MYDRALSIERTPVKVKRTTPEAEPAVVVLGPWPVEIEEQQRFFPEGIVAWDQLIDPRIAWPWPYSEAEVVAISEALGDLSLASACIEDVVRAARLLLHAKVRKANTRPKENPLRDAKRLRKAAVEIIAAIKDSELSHDLLGLDGLGLIKLKYEADRLQHSLPERDISKIAKRFGRSADTDDRDWMRRLHKSFQNVRSVTAAKATFQSFVDASAAPLIRMRLPNGLCALKARGNWWDLLRGQPRIEKVAPK